MKAQSSQSLGTAQLLGGHNHIYRYDPVVQNNRFSLDGIKEINSLKGMGFTKAREALPVIEKVFFDHLADPFQPYHQIAI
ncbi:hypothetical protein D3C73_1584260 [compost metagenome]